MALKCDVMKNLADRYELAYINQIYLSIFLCYVTRFTSVHHCILNNIVY
jgi:hypothetical protein